MGKDVWNRIRGGGPLAIAGLVFLLLAGVGDVLVVAGVGVPMQGDQAPRAVLALVGLVLVLAFVGWWVTRRPTLDRPDPAWVDRWFALLFGLGQAFTAAGLLLSHR